MTSDSDFPCIPNTGILILDERRVVVKVSEEFCRTFSCDENEVLGCVFDELISKRDHTGRGKYFQALMCPSDSDNYFELFLNLQLSSCKHVIRLRMYQIKANRWHVFTEALEGTKVETLLRRQRHWNAIIRSSSDGIAICDDTGCIVEFNSQFVTLLQASTSHGVRKLDDSFQNQQLCNVLTGELHRRVCLDLLDVPLHKQRLSIEVSHHGMRLAVQLSAAQVGTGAFLGLVLVIRDVTAQFEHGRLSKAVEQTSESIIITDLAGKILYVNPACEQISGYTREESLGKTPSLYKSGIQPNAVYEQLWETINAGKVWSGRLSNRKKDGTTYIEETTISPVHDESGTITNYVAVKKDITEQLALETRANQSQKLESIGQLAAGIAHEINTPIQFVGDNTVFLQRAFTGLVAVASTCESLVSDAKRGDIAPEIMEAAEKTLKKAKIKFLIDQVPKAIEQSLDGLKRVTGIVSAMKEFSHPSQGLKQPIDLHLAIQTTVTVCRSEWKYVAEIITDFDPNLPPVPCLGDELNQVILNIVVNAAHAISDVTNKGETGKGTISLATSHTEEWVELRISDTGCGIPEAVRQKIFDPFFTTKKVGQGTGQGLAIARSVVVDKHGGSIELESELGKSTTFIIRLPLFISNTDEGLEEAT